jgi:hypothetical protein
MAGTARPATGGDRSLRKRAILGEEELRRVQADELAGAHLLHLHAAGELAGAQPHEGDAVAVVGVHVGLDLEDEAGDLGIGGIDGVGLGGLRSRRGRVFRQRAQQRIDAEGAQRRAELRREPPQRRKELLPGQ